MQHNIKNNNNPIFSSDLLFKGNVFLNDTLYKICELIKEVASK